MPKMIANRDVRVASLSGHVYLFKANVVQGVAHGAVNDCLAVGVILAPGETLDTIAPTKDVPGGEARLAQIKEVTISILARNERDDFGASGRPTARAVDSRCGFKTSEQERDMVWSAVKYQEQQHRDREALRRQKPSDQDALYEAIATVIDMLVARGAEDDFSRDNEPHVKAIEEHLGYTITHEERDEVWKRYKARTEESAVEPSTEDALKEVSDTPTRKKAGRPRKPVAPKGAAA